MARALLATLVVIHALADIAGAQPPSIGFAPGPEIVGPPVLPLATLGDPQILQVPPPTAPNYTGSYTTVPRPATDPVSVTRPGEPLVPQDAVNDTWPGLGRAWFENMSVSFGVDGSKEPADLGVNANFGYRLAFNWGLPIFEQAGIGAQVGTAVNYSRNALRLLPFVDGTVDRWQSFTTVGVFQRAPGGLRWGVAYDFRFDDYYDNFGTGQWRAQLGFEVSPDNEFGVLGTFRDHGDGAAIGPLSFSVQPISQWNFYWRHVWSGEIATRLWIGLAAEHSRFNLLIPGQPQVNHPFTFGGDFFVPLSDHLALFGEAHFITPNDTGVISATLGVALYPGSARGTARSRFAPLFPVANNTSFALDAR